MDKYKVTIWWSELDQRFLAEMPELPGAMADGQTQEEALANMKEVAQVWINTAKEAGWPIPEPGQERVAA